MFINESLRFYTNDNTGGTNCICYCYRLCRGRWSFIMFLTTTYLWSIKLSRCSLVDHARVWTRALRRWKVCEDQGQHCSLPSQRKSPVLHGQRRPCKGYSQLSCVPSPEMRFGESRSHKAMSGNLRVAFSVQGDLILSHISQHPFSGGLCCIFYLHSTGFSTVGLPLGRWLLCTWNHKWGNWRAKLILYQRKKMRLLWQQGLQEKLALKNFSLFCNTEILEGKREGRQSHYNPFFPQK